MLQGMIEPGEDTDANCREDEDRSDAGQHEKTSAHQ